MRGMLKAISACLVVCASLLVWADGAGAGGAKGAKSPSVKLPGPAFVALETITPDHIRWHVRYLSHDLLEGRGTGQRGGDIAAEYIATQFAEYGLKPAGDHGTYMQKVPLVGITTLPETQFLLVPKQGESMNLKPLDEFVAYDQTQQPQSDVDADIVFVGYGIEAPEYNWDDYKGLDVRGKVLLMLVNEPPSDGGGAQGSGGSAPRTSDADGELSVGSGKELEFRRKVRAQVRRSGSESCVVGATGCGEEVGIGLRYGSGEDDERCADAGVSPGESKGAP